MHQETLLRLQANSASKVMEKVGYAHWKQQSARATIRAWHSQTVAGHAARRAFSFLADVSKQGG